MFDHQRFDFIDRQRAGPIGNQIVELGLVATARDMVDIARVLGQLGPAHRGAQAAEHRVLIGADEIFAIAGRIDVRRRDAGQNTARAVADIARGGIFRHQAFHHLQHGFIKRGVNDLTFAGLVAMAQRGECAHATVGGRKTIADRHTHAARRAIGVADDGAPAAHRLSDAAKTGAVRIRSGLAIAGDADDNETGVFSVQRCRTHAPFFECARTEIFDQDVGGGDELPHQRLRFGIAQIGADRFLVARHDLPPKREITAAPDAHRVAAGLAIGSWRLDLDDLCPHIAKQLSAEWTSDELAHFDNADAGQRPGVFGHGDAHSAAMARG